MAARGPTALNLRIAPNDGLQLLALTVMFAPTLDEAQELGIRDQKRHQLVTLITWRGTAGVIQGAKDHLHRDPFQGFAQNLCDLLTDHQ